MRTPEFSFIGFVIVRGRVCGLMRLYIGIVSTYIKRDLYTHISKEIYTYQKRLTHEKNTHIYQKKSLLYIGIVSVRSRVCGTHVCEE